jgi:hypothetical protein
MGWSAYIDLAVTRLAGVTGISYAARAAGLDPEKLLLIPQWPAGLVIDGGGNADVYSGDITERTMSIVIAVFVPAGTLGTQASQQLGTISEAVVEAFTHTANDSTIRILSESDEMAEQVGGGEVYMRALNFSYDTLR